MTTDTLDRLRAADPARDLEVPVPEDLLTRLVSTPRRRRRRRTRRAALAVPFAVAASIAGFALLAPDVTPPDLAARAYAQTAVPAEEILYTRITSRTESNGPGVPPSESRTEERWQLGARWHTISRHSSGERFEEYLDADGVLHFTNGDTARRSDGGDARMYIDQHAPGFLREFRQAYERGALDPAGDTTFNGRAAKRYIVTWDRSRAEYFIDADTGTPLGSRSVMAIYGPDRTSQIGEQRTTVVVEALESLPPTRENLNRLTPG
ncbi:hypothetical protein DVA67_027070 [Solirubrobacter sp. CPCC 204708]|uniref:Uncharacterized protein n=1 Tax=Solirubrobacter deserti TaxID=2282478 RepID=A0ABT4RGV8_9ACTN|nr:hypothetical protein [Solirubrobacter deserti]MBE2319660.1 hypothetical protein [Solirubrobacter deserti]MDA0137601.1 hypothetical protein [Solirubrobacter deserti]